MAVSLFNAGGVGGSPTPNFGTSALVSITTGGANRALLVSVIFTGSAPGTVTAVWDSVGANQSMTLIRSWDSGTGYYFYLFGLIAPAVLSGSAASVSWTSNSSFIAFGSCWNGVKQTSVAAAFT